MSFSDFFDISLETANRFYTWGWKASLIGAAITFAGVSLLMWGTRVRENASAPRSISLEQEEFIANKMSVWAKLPSAVKLQSVAVFPTSSAFESAALANQIASALQKSGWKINRNHVNFGMSFSVAGVGILTSANQRAILVATDLIKTLNKEKIYSFMLPVKRSGCEEMKYTKEHIDNEPFCSQISIFVGDHP